MRALQPPRWPLPGTATDAVLWLLAVAFLGQIFLDRQLSNFGADGQGSVLGFDSASLWAGGAYAPQAIVKSGEWWRLFLPAWLHAGLLHFGMNAMVLWQFGRIVESLFGPYKMLFAYLCSGVATTGLSLAWDLSFTETPKIAIGASGAIMGLGGLLLVTFWRRKDMVARMMTRQLAQWAIFIFVIGFIVPFIDQVGHAAGFAAGAVLGLILRNDRLAAFHRGSLRTRLRGLLTLALIGINLLAIGFVGASALPRMEGEFALQKTILSGQTLAQDRAFGETPESLRAAVVALKARPVPKEAQSAHAALVAALQQTPFNRIEAERALEELRALYRRLEPDGIWLRPVEIR